MKKTWNLLKRLFVGRNSERNLNRPGDNTGQSSAMGKHQYTCDRLEEPIDFASDSGQASPLLPAPDICDSRILDPATYEQIRGNISPPPSDGPLRLRFRAPESPPRDAKWAIEDYDLDTLTWLDVGGLIWEKAQTGSVQHSGMVSVPVWWERAGARTEAYVNERTRLVVFYKLDGRIKVSSLPADVSTSSHNFFGYFPRKGRARLWFAPKTTGLSKEREQNHRLSHVRPPGNTSHAAVVENPAFDLDLMRRAVEGGLPNSGNSSAATPRSGVACYGSLQLTTEEMKVLMSSAEETRLRRGYAATVEEKQTGDSAAEETCWTRRFEPTRISTRRIIRGQASPSLQASQFPSPLTSQ